MRRRELAFWPFLGSQEKILFWAFWGSFFDRVQGVPSGLGLGLVDFNFDCSTVCPNSASAGGNLAEVAWQLGKRVEHSDQS